MQEGHLIKSAFELAKALNDVADENMPAKLAGIVTLHSGIAVGSALIPIPGADMAATAANIWTMYVRINKELDLPFTENFVQSIVAGVVTNIGGAAASFLVVGSLAKFVPGLGSIGGAAVMIATVYAVTLASGIVYMKAITKLLNAKSAEGISEEDLKSAANEILKDKESIKSILKEGKAEYKKSKESGGV